MTGMIDIKPPKRRPLQFTAEAAASAFCAGFLDEKSCREWVLTTIHDLKPACPRCGSAVAPHLLDRFWDNKRVRCPGCRNLIEATTGTFLTGTRLTFSKVMILAVLIALQVPASDTARIAGVDLETVRQWRLRFELARALAPSADSTAPRRSPW